MNDALPLALALSCAGLAFGPLLLALGRGRSLLGAAIDGLTLSLVPVIILLRLLPHVYESLGALALLLALFAYLALWLFDRAQHRAATGLGDTMILSALLAHAITDGVSLASAVASTRGLSPGSGTPLIAALLVHRLPEGLFIATTLVPRLGWRRALMRILLIAATSVAAAIFGHALLDHLPEIWFEGVVALGLGAMLRLVLHSHASPSLTAGSRLASGIGFLIGFAFAIGIPTPHDVLRAAQPRELSIVESLLPLFVDTAPAVLIGLLVAGLMRLYLPRHPVTWLASGGALRLAIRGVRFGLPLPVPHTGVLPRARGLSRQAVPVAAVVAFVISSGELAADGAFVSLHLLGLPLTVLRLAGGLILAVAVGCLTGARAASTVEAHLPLQGGVAPEASSGLMKLGASLRDDLAPWYCAGLAIAATLEAALMPGALAQLGFPLALLLALMVSGPGWISTTALLPIVAVLLHKGLSPAAALGIFLIGPTLDVRMLALVGRAYGRGALLRYVAGIIVGCLLLCSCAVLIPGAAPSLHVLAAMSPVGSTSWNAAIVVGASFLLGLLRSGPRAWFARMTPEQHHDHAH